MTRLWPMRLSAVLVGGVVGGALLLSLRLWRWSPPGLGGADRDGLVMLLISGVWLGAALILGAHGLTLVLWGRQLQAAVRALVDRVRASAEGGDAAGPLPEDVELAGVAGSFDRMAVQLRAAVRDVAQARRELDDVLQSLGDGIIALDANGKLLLVNRAARELVGEEQPLDQVAFEELCRNPALLELAEEACTGQPGQVEVELAATLHRPERRILATARSRDRGGAVMVLRDVTAVRRLETIRRDFVANVSHELRTPVSVIRSSAEALCDGALEEAEVANRLTANILRQSDRLGLLLADLLTLSRVEAGSFRIHTRPVAARGVVEDALTSLDERARARRHTIAVLLDPEVVVRADPNVLEQVFINLIDNAVKYTPEGGNIQIRGGGWVAGQRRIEIVDDGPGIPPRHRERLFERFYRVDAGRSRELGGTGLGLAIVKHLVEAMGGAVGVEAGRPKGSVFWFSLPDGAIEGGVGEE